MASVQLGRFRASVMQTSNVMFLVMMVTSPLVMKTAGVARGVAIAIVEGRPF